MVYVKALVLPLCLGFACALAGLYGMVHNQISYTVAPEYFHGFKFIQFGFDPALQTRWGASLVGLYASWWMGVFLGVPLYVAALFVRGFRPFVRTYLIAAACVVTVTLLSGISALIWSYAALSPDHLPEWVGRFTLNYPLRFARAGTMHNAAYLGAGLGLVVGLIYVIFSARRSRMDGV